MSNSKTKAITELDYKTLKKILDNSYDEIYVTNAEGIVIYVNNAAERHYGVKAADIIGKSSQEISEKKLWGPRVSPIAIKRKRSFTLEQKTCTGKTLLTTATPIWDEEGNLELVVENSRDITETEGIKYELEKSMQLLKKYKMEVEELRKKELNSPDFICQSKKMCDLLELAQRIAAVDSTVLLLGESGTGKGVIAKYIHKNSSRNKGPFIPINCASIPSELMESELFGYSKGAFTGANEKGKMGLIELASEGTLFLDEIGELPMKMQAKLLQVLQDNEYFKVGGREVQKVNCRIIAATNRNLKEMVENGQFREDLYYRLNIFEIEIPPLRERPEEIIPLVQFFLDKFNNKYKVSHQISQNCLNILIDYPWPGNVRELENTIERLVVVSPETIIEERHLPKHFREEASKNHSVIMFPRQMPLDEAINEVEKNLIEKAYRELGSSYEVAKALKTSQSKASRLIRKYCINKDKGKEKSGS
ncbi:MAG: sigma-54 interaction domain-containing protein [Bacillota bacterium]|nr:sigma 54-interacting transcriptional regulator [Clostridia bacterium]